MAANKSPKWLEPLWEKKKTETARRVEQAVREMVRKCEPVTLDGIRQKVKALFGVSISANTIQRNEGAYAVYEKHRTARHVSRTRNTTGATMLRGLARPIAVSLRAKINRLRRQTKDSLIVRLLQLEEERKRQSGREDSLREEILRLHFSAGRKGGGQ